MGGLDVAVIVVYFAAIIGLGIFGSRRAKTSEDYLVAGRKMGYPVTVACLSALTLGGASTVGTVGLGYRFGISGFWLVAMMGVGLILTGYIVVRKVGGMKLFTVSQLLEKRYGYTASTLSAVVSAIYTMMTCATQIIAMGAVFQVVAGWDAVASMVVVGLVVVVYSLLGGMLAVTMTDVVQFGFIVFGVLVILLPKSLGAAGGVENLVASVPAAFLDFGNIGFDTIVQYFLLYALGIMVGQDIWQRFFTARSIKVARRSSLGAGAFAVIYGASTAVIGMCAFIAMPGMQDPQLVLGTFASSILGSGVLGFVVAAILAALMSTASGTLIASASLIVNSLVNPATQLVRKRRGLPEPPSDEADRHTMHLARIMMAVVGVAAIGLAVTFGDIVIVLDVCYALLTGALFVPIMLGIYWKRATPKAAIASISVGSVSVFAALAVFGVESVVPIVIGLGVSLVVMVSVSLLGEAKHAADAEDSLSNRTCS